MSVDNAMAGIAVRDLKTGLDWYRRVLGRKPDSQPMSEVAQWHFPQGGWLQVFQDAGRAGSCTVTLSVSDIQNDVAQLMERGVAVEAHYYNERVSVAIVKDLDGNRIVFAQPSDPTIAQ